MQGTIRGCKFWKACASQRCRREHWRPFHSHEGSVMTAQRYTMITTSPWWSGLFESESYESWLTILLRDGTGRAAIIKSSKQTFRAGDKGFYIWQTCALPHHRIIFLNLPLWTCFRTFYVLHTQCNACTVQYSLCRNFEPHLVLISLLRRRQIFSAALCRWYFVAILTFFITPKCAWLSLAANWNTII